MEIHDTHDAEKKRLHTSINKWRQDRYSAQRRWSGVHHSVLFGSIVCSVLAGALIQYDFGHVASIFTAVAAVLTGIAASGGFERKWKSNRLSRSKADCLIIDLEDPQHDLNHIRHEFKSAIEKHDLEVVGDRKEEQT